MKQVKITVGVLSSIGQWRSAAQNDRRSSRVSTKTQQRIVGTRMSSFYSAISTILLRSYTVEELYM